jgi:hypothetical protein
MEGLPAGPAPTDCQVWLDSLGLPPDLLKLMKWDWPQVSCRIGHDTLLSAESISRDAATARLLQHKFLNVGSASDGDWMVIDFFTDTCQAGLIPHDQWNPWDEDQGDPREFFWAAHSVEDFLGEGVNTSSEIWREHEEAKIRAASRGPLVFSASHHTTGKCTFASVPIPDGYKLETALDSDRTMWFVPPDRKGGMVVSTFSPHHKYVSDASEGRMNFREFPVGKNRWRLAMPDARARSLDSFIAILPLKHEAIAVYASDLYWGEIDIRAFLAAIRLTIDG